MSFVLKPHFRFANLEMPRIEFGILNLDVLRSAACKTRSALKLDFRVFRRVACQSFPFLGFRRSTSACYPRDTKGS